MIWDGTSKRFHCEISMNKATNMELDALITFGYAYMAFCICIWRPRIYFPHGEILLAFVDISSYFCFPRISADLVGAFGFMVGWTMVLHGQYNVLRQCCFCKLVGAISLTNCCFSIGILLSKMPCKKHRSLLDLATWDDEPSHDGVFVQVTACSKYREISKLMDQKSLHHMIFMCMAI